MAFDTHALEIHDVAVPVPKLPRPLEGFTIAHLTDTHLRTLGPLEEHVLAAVHARAPALVVLTGDMVSSRQALPVLTEFCRALRASGRPVVAIRGNHEVYSRVSVATLRQLYRRVGVQLLVNEHLVLNPALILVGTGDSVTRHYNLPAAVRGMPTSAVRIHLSHAPEVFDWPGGGSLSFALCLAGHTHGGQIRLPFLPPYVPRGAGPRFVAGWYAQTRQGPAYISRGIGTTGLPVRLNCPPELPFLSLRRA
jgi:predicted MPP superfamily phosphohydrolase